ncbi:MAG: MauE/DoxX family redox-associated membrane protein [Verrucomicrobiaceae bacterium]
MNPALRESNWLRGLHVAVAWIFGGVFIFSGYVKVRDPQLFLMQIRGFHLLPDPFAAWLALGLPWLEIFCGAAVITGVLRRGGLLLLGMALVTFLAVLSFAWATGLDIECGCFGSAVKTSLRVELLIDLVLLGMCIWLLRRAIGQTCFAREQVL